MGSGPQQKDPNSHPGPTRGTHSWVRAWWTDTADCYQNLLLGPASMCYLLGAGRLELPMFHLTTGRLWNPCCLWAWALFLARETTLCFLSGGQHGAWRPPLPCPPTSVLRFRYLFGNVLWTTVGDKEHISSLIHSPQWSWVVLGR